MTSKRNSIVLWHFFGFNSRLYEMLMSVFYLSMQLNAPRCVALAILIGTSQLVNNIRSRRIWKSSIRLDTKIRLYQTYIVPVLLYGCETWSTTKLQCSRIDAFDMWALRKILTIPYTAIWRMWKSEQPPDAVLSPTWSLTDVCGSLDILPAAHHKRTTTVLSLRWSGGCLQIGSDHQEDPATPGFVQWRQCSRIDAFDMWALRKILTIPYTAMWRMWKSEQPRDAVLSPTWSLTDICGSLDILPAAHHKRTTTVLSLRWSGGCLQIGSDR